MLSVNITLAITGLLTLITVCSVFCENVSDTTTQGKCDEVYLYGNYRFNCSSYSEFPTNIKDLRYVDQLYMEGVNNMEILRNGSLIRSKLTRLALLSMQHCKIRVVEPNAFSGGDSLKIIDLSNNLITVLNPDIIKDLPRLKELNIANNPINIIESDKQFSNSLYLDTLNSGGCMLDTISTIVFDSMWDLKSLNLSGNHFKSLEWNLFQGKRHLTFLGLEGNPWHCDCHVKFLMETLKHMKYARFFENNICTSAEIPKWQGFKWSHVPDKDMTCHPQITKLVYSCWSPFSQIYEHIDTVGTNESLELGQDVYFECKFEGFPKPKIEWFKNDKPIKKHLNTSAILSVNGGNIQPRIEFLDDDHNENSFDFKFREVLVVRQIEMDDKGIYACVVSTKHMTVRKEVTLLKINIPCKANGDSDLALWKSMTIIFGFILAILITSIIVFVFFKKGKGERSENIQDPGIQLGEMDVQPTNSISKDTTVTSLI